MPGMICFCSQTFNWQILERYIACVSTYCSASFAQYIKFLQLFLEVPEFVIFGNL